MTYDQAKGKSASSSKNLTEIVLASRWLLAALFASSLLVRLTAWVVVPDPHLSTNAMLAYLGGADIILNGEGFSDPNYPMFTPPLYALCIAASHLMFGASLAPIVLTQIICDSLTTVIVYLIILIIFGSRPALFTACIMVVYPFAVYATLYIGPEAYFTFLLAVFVLFMLQALRGGRSGCFGAAGFVLGLATMMRGTTQFFPLFLLMALPIFVGIERRLVGGMMVFVLSFAMALTPWTLRNAMVLGKPVPVAAGGIVFLWGSSPNFLVIEERDRTFPAFLESLRASGIVEPSRDSDPVEKERFVFRAGIENYRRQLERDPLGTLMFLFNKIGRLWYATESGNNHGITLGVNTGIYLLALAGIGLAWKARLEHQWLLLVMLLYFAVLHWVTLPLFRYVLPIMPYITGYAMYAWEQLTWGRRLDRLRTGDSGRHVSVRA